MARKQRLIDRISHSGQASGNGAYDDAVPADDSSYMPQQQYGTQQQPYPTNEQQYAQYPDMNGSDAYAGTQYGYDEQMQSEQYGMPGQYDGYQQNADAYQQYGTQSPYAYGSQEQYQAATDYHENGFMYPNECAANQNTQYEQDDEQYMPPYDGNEQNQGYGYDGYDDASEPYEDEAKPTRKEMKRAKKEQKAQAKRDKKDAARAQAESAASEYHNYDVNKNIDVLSLRKSKKFVRIGIVAFILVIGLGGLVYYFSGSTVSGKQKACWTYEQKVEALAESYAETNGMSSYPTYLEDVPGFSDIEQGCPDGGEYTWNPVTGEYTCSEHGHYPDNFNAPESKTESVQTFKNSNSSSNSSSSSSSSNSSSSSSK